VNKGGPAGSLARAAETATARSSPRPPSRPEPTARKLAVRSGIAHGLKGYGRLNPTSDGSLVAALARRDSPPQEGARV